MVCKLSSEAIKESCLRDIKTSKCKFCMSQRFKNLWAVGFNMGITLIKIKLMPNSPDADLKKIEKKAKEVIEDNKGIRVVFNEEPIAFGLKAIIISFDQDEDGGELEPIENALAKIENVSSCQIIDMRRAFGWVNLYYESLNLL